MPIPKLELLSGVLERPIRIAVRGVEIVGRGVFDVELDLDERHGLYECVGLAVRAPGRRVDGDVLRRIKVAELVRAAALWLEESGVAADLERAVLPASLRPPLGYVDRFAHEYVQPPMTPDEHGVAMERREQEVVEPARQDAARWRRMVREAARAGGQTRLEAGAAIYKRALRRHDPAPTKAVQRELGVTYNAAIGIVRRARAAGLLPATQPTGE